MGASRTKKQIINETRLALVQKFPAAFFPHGCLKKPLKIGIISDLIERAKPLRPFEIKLALADYCFGPTYRAAFIAGAFRVDLDGNPVGVIAGRHLSHAEKRMESFSETTRTKWRAVAMATERGGLSQPV